MRALIQRTSARTLFSVGMFGVVVTLVLMQIYLSNARRDAQQLDVQVEELEATKSRLEQQASQLEQSILEQKSELHSAQSQLRAVEVGIRDLSELLKRKGIRESDVLLAVEALRSDLGAARERTTADQNETPAWILPKIADTLAGHPDLDPQVLVDVFASSPEALLAVAKGILRQPVGVEAGERRRHALRLAERITERVGSTRTGRDLAEVREVQGAVRVALSEMLSGDEAKTLLANALTDFDFAAQNNGDFDTYVHSIKLFARLGATLEERVDFACADERTRGFAHRTNHCAMLVWELSQVYWRDGNLERARALACRARDLLSVTAYPDGTKERAGLERKKVVYGERCDSGG